MTLCVCFTSLCTLLARVRACLNSCLILILVNVALSFPSAALFNSCLFSFHILPVPVPAQLAFYFLSFFHQLLRPLGTGSGAYGADSRRWW